ncbi:MAG TPA: CoA transferase [Streptosporangiaceae bacterium]|nr:CoA transferase [Streptosporangiaceae bacterium]
MSPRASMHGVRVIDCATLFAGPMAATILGDFGADVIKVEHPAKGDPSRGHGPQKDGIGLWWKILGRNKQTVTLNLGRSRGAEIFRDLVASADVLIENFRPGTMERWGLGPDELLSINPRLVMARVTGFGQFGPYAQRAGFGTLAESMSGFAAMTGDPDGPPTLPPFGLADGVTALTTAIAILMALYRRDTGAGSGQVIDLAIIEPLVTLLGAQTTVFDQLGLLPERMGNRSGNNAPRNTYQTADRKWVAVSTSAQSVAERVLRLVGHPEVIDEPWFADGTSRARHAEELDSYVADWIARRTRSEVIEAFERAEAAVAPVYDVRDVLADPQYQALGTVTTIDDEDFGPLRMPNVMFRMSGTPGAIRWAGRSVGADNESVFCGRLGLTADELAKLREAGVV